MSGPKGLAGAGASAASVSFDRVAHCYDETRGGAERGELFASAVLPHLPRPGRVLDLGVGTASVAGPLAAAGVDLVGIDLSPAMLARARSRLGNRVAVADGARLPLADASVAAACSVWLLHLVADQSAVAREVARVVRPGGVWVVVPTAGSDPGESDVAAVMVALWRDLRPSGLEGQVGVQSAVEAGGFRLEHTDMLVQGWQTTPRSERTKVEQRQLSSLFDLDEAAWRAVVQPRLDLLAALPDQDRPRTGQAAYQIMVFRRD